MVIRTNENTGNDMFETIIFEVIIVRYIFKQFTEIEYFHFRFPQNIPIFLEIYMQSWSTESTHQSTYRNVLCAPFVTGTIGWMHNRLKC